MIYRSLILFSLLLSLGSFQFLLASDERAKEPNDVVLETKTVEVMVDQLEKMTRVTEDERNAWAQLFMDVEKRFSKIITYETRDNLDLWKLVGRWATTEGLANRSPYANAPFFHIQRLRPDYTKDEEVIRLMAKLNAIRNKEHQYLEADGYRNFVYLFEKCDTGDAGIQLQIGRAYDEGYGLWRNNTEAVKWYKRSATAGNADAIGELGDKYLLGSGDLEKNEDTGVKLLNEAVAKGSASAACHLGFYYGYGAMPLWGKKGDKKKSIEMYKIAAERGYYKAFYPLAKQYEEVDNGIESLRWANGGDEPNVGDKIAHSNWEFNRSMADSGGTCSYIKGEVYALGIGGIKEDLTKARELFEESYQKGFSEAAESLSAMYREGIGVEANSALAEQWENNAVKTFGVASVTSRDWHENNIKAFARRLRRVSAGHKASN